MQICKPCTHIIIVQIMINSAFHHYLYTWNGCKIPCIDIQGWRMHYKEVFFNIFLLKYNLTINLNILPMLFITKNSSPKQKVITKMMNENNQIFSLKTLCFYKLMFYFIFVQMNLNHNFFIPPYLLKICHIVIFNVTCEMGWITYT